MAPSGKFRNVLQSGVSAARLSRSIPGIMVFMTMNRIQPPVRSDVQEVMELGYETMLEVDPAEPAKAKGGPPGGEAVERFEKIRN